jgi:hypothetical protein
MRRDGQGTFTAGKGPVGSGPVGSGTKWASPRDIAESAAIAVMMIAISRIGSP